MSLTSGTNKWASRAVVVLQFAAWSAVGIVLLEKGVASLRKTANDLSATNDDNNNNDALQREHHQEQNLVAIDASSVTDDDVLSVIPFDGQMMVDDNKNSLATTIIVRGTNRSTKEINEEENEESTTRMLIEALNLQPTAASNASITGKNGVKELDKPMSNNGANIIPAIANEDKTSSNRLDEFESHRQNDSANKIAVSGKDGDEVVERDKQIIEKQKTGQIDGDGLSHQVAAERQRHEESTWSPITTRKHFRIGQMSVGARGNGGAAAAIAMVTVGVIMLVLGPAVILLRTLDERRQERRFLKLTGDEEDLPPSYEQATASSLADEQAPTYSSLNLNSISC